MKAKNKLPIAKIDSLAVPVVPEWMSCAIIANPARIEDRPIIAIPGVLYVRPRAISL